MRRMIMLRRRHVAARDFFSTILDTTTAPLASALTGTPASKETGLLSSSPADTQGKKRTRSALRSLNINDGSPEKKDSMKPPRKASRASSNSNKENGSDTIDGQENMVLDA